MSTWAARKLAQITENLVQVLAMEYLAAAQAVEMHRPLTTSAALEKAIRRLRDRVPGLEDDRAFAPDIAAAADLVEGLGPLGE